MAHNPTIYWHDYETFGLNKHIDRPAQFGGMRTDMEMNPIGEPDLWYCRPSPDYLPQPAACLVTGITPQEASEKGLSEAEFARRIFERFNTPDTLVIGYNNFKFDDEVTRALFWRNLRDMYSHQFRNGCSRWDLFPFVLAVWALRDEGIVWPQKASDDPQKPSRVSFRLEHLTQANGIEHSHAHDALSDVEATALLAKLIAQKQPKLWKWALANRTKEAVKQTLSNPDPVVWVDPSAGQQSGFLRFVMPVSAHPVNSNEDIVWDCRFDPMPLASMSSEEIWRLTWAPRDMRQEGETRLSLCNLRLNQSPFVCSDLRIINERVKSRFAIDMDEVMENARKLAQILPLIQGTIAEALQDKRGDRVPADDVDAQLYDSFMGDVDRDVARSVLKLTPEELAQKVEEGRLHFDDPRLNELLFRMRAHSYPETLSESELQRFKALAQENISGSKQKRLSLQEYIETIETLAEENDQAEESEEITSETAQHRAQVLEALSDWGEYVGDFAQN